MGSYPTLVSPDIGRESPLNMCTQALFDPSESSHVIFTWDVDACKYSGCHAMDDERLHNSKYTLGYKIDPTGF